MLPRRGGYARQVTSPEWRSVGRPRRARRSMDRRPARARKPYKAHGMVASRAPPTERGGRASNASFGRMTNNEPAAFYRRYNACCNEHRSRTLPSSLRPAWRSTAPTADLMRTPPSCEPSYARSLTIGGVAPPRGRCAVDRRALHRHRNAPRGIPRRPGDRSLGRRPGVAFYRVDAGQIAEVWGSAFHVHLLEQLR
jgi:hypothetical protein